VPTPKKKIVKKIVKKVVRNKSSGDAAEATASAGASAAIGGTELSKDGGLPDATADAGRSLSGEDGAAVRTTFLFSQRPRWLHSRLLQANSAKTDEDTSCEAEMIKMMQLGLIRCLDTNEYALCLPAALQRQRWRWRSSESIRVALFAATCP
jgi:hypothetical protein